MVLTPIWHANKYKVNKTPMKVYGIIIFSEFMYLVFLACHVIEIYRRRLRSLVLCDIIRALINSLVLLILRGQAFSVMSFKHRNGKPRAAVKHYWKCSRQCHVFCQTLLEHAWEQGWSVSSNAVDNSADNYYMTSALLGCPRAVWAEECSLAAT